MANSFQTNSLKTQRHFQETLLISSIHFESIEPFEQILSVIKNRCFYFRFNKAIGWNENQYKNQQ